jgi:SpoVK/Ycf46/Vps4 family AAA+-type ATPase
MPSSSGATEIVSSADDFPFPAFSPKACSSFVSSFSITNNSGAATAGSKQATEEPACLHGEDVDYIRDHCLMPSEELKTFSADVIGNPQLAAFADQYQPVVSAAERAISGLLLFGPPGTGKSIGAQAVASKIGAKFYNFGAADLPNGKAGANRVNALFDVALAEATPDNPAVIFIDECDTILNVKATVRAGHFATRFERFMPCILVIGATNEPQNISPRILNGRFERKIFVGNPNGDARRHMILRQLGQGEKEHTMSSSELDTLVQNTAGRSAVNMQRLISTAVQRAGFIPVMLVHFQDAMSEEPSDYDPVNAEKNFKYNQKYGWRGNVSLAHILSRLC